MRLFRPRLGTIQLVSIVSAYLVLLTNETFWRKGFAYFAGHEVQLVGLGLALFLLCFAALTTFSVKYVVKPLLVFAIAVSALASYFVDTFGLVIDRDMITNVVLTTPAEAGHLMTGSFFLHLLLFGALPSVLVALVRVEHRSFRAKVRRHSAFIFPSLIAAAAIVYAFYPGFSSIFRSHGDLMASFHPAAPIVAGVKVALSDMAERNIVAAPLGTDAKRGPIATASAKPIVTVVVVGETARSMNFGLNGYRRDTTPELAARDVVSFQNVTSCGTSTAVSVPCMFSNLTKANYSSKAGRSVENLTDVLAHAGLDVRWFDNDTGSMHVADRRDYEFLPASNDPRFCAGGECHDDILVERLRLALDDIHRDTVIVLHQLGSHGPAYHERYPQAAERFQPACRSAEFTDCTREEIVNAYDNTILYTDHVLSEVIDLLGSREDLASSMLYVSDHGESLGENGLYLHGMPYFLAPSTQTHVPMIAWFSKPYEALTGLQAACLEGRKGEALSHDNLFHTVLGTADVVTSVYQTGLDAFAPCRSRQSSTHLAANPAEPHEVLR
ncbi:MULTISPECIES: phosphoethanolamine transferase [unclassified Aureimonas]|uniref:phosphoethanolamine transferase n=1 Tax=unclassified Aureimonas TaxID=2615206 RepID=UPI0006FE3F18|nr:MULTISPECIES: phosphoethanolamine--lipid A transferase [unclassified Aureimonas]KQT53040.1 sulfatase [Aureimonas sp. Leaf427]KQT80496.1 sulfatase [Aureimonas sp. Leaf460]